MGSTEQYCLRWNDFQSNITGAFSDIRDDEDFLDVTLVSEGQTIKAHKLVLSACSPLFRSMLKKNTHPQPMIFLHGVRFSDMSAILNFMYHGEVNVNQEDLQTFLGAAEELRIRGLSDRSAMESPSSPRPPAKRARTGGEASSSKTKATSSPSRASSPSAAGRLSSADDRTKAGLVVTPDLQDFDQNSSSTTQDEQVNPEYAPGIPYDNSLNLFSRAGSDGGRKDEGSSNGFGAHSSGWTSNNTSSPGSMASIFTSQLIESQQQLFGGLLRSTCPYCRKEMKNAHSLNVHISRYHTEGSQSAVEVRCPVCQRKYGNKYSLRTHMHLNHKDQLHLLGSGRRGRKPAQAEEPRASSANVVEDKKSSTSSSQGPAAKEEPQEAQDVGYYI